LHAHLLVRLDRLNRQSYGSGRERIKNRHNRPLVRFESEAVGDTITIKVQFDSDDLAELFRQAFSGSYAA